MSWQTCGLAVVKRGLSLICFHGLEIINTDCARGERNKPSVIRLLTCIDAETYSLSCNLFKI